jgi:hypothetical protein
LQVRGTLVRLAKRLNRRIYCHKGTGVWRNAKIERLAGQVKTAIGMFESLEFSVLAIRGRRARWRLLDVVAPG